MRLNTVTNNLKTFWGFLWSVCHISTVHGCTVCLTYRCFTVLHFWPLCETHLNFILHENHFGLREGCGGTIRVFLLVDEQWGLSFEMTVFATDASVDVDVPEGNDSSALKEHAAVENAALEALHWFSLQEKLQLQKVLFLGTVCLQAPLQDLMVLL